MKHCFHKIDDSPHSSSTDHICCFCGRRDFSGRKMKPAPLDHGAFVPKEFYNYDPKTANDQECPARLSK